VLESGSSQSSISPETAVRRSIDKAFSFSLVCPREFMVRLIDQVELFLS
jgi:hypothetical protein